jgi:cell division protein FtsB
MMQPGKLVGFAALGAVILASLSFGDARGLRRIQRLDQDIRQREDKNAALDIENAKLRREIHALQGDPRALERAAREELGLIKDGEVVFTF